MTLINLTFRAFMLRCRREGGVGLWGRDVAEYVIQSEGMYIFNVIYLRMLMENFNMIINNKSIVMLAPFCS